ncbi:hypothetical protein [Brucella pseudogrignonensis]|uniref:Uncharacterized protein n=1 Tax=Ochrobactrum phage POA1180 TaxID=1897640 RepID=A0A219VHC3_9CAUD|nr:hypothetical protein [Brucella pseudogrignonensis]YP_010665121.1 hypothetical protein PQB33_gp38 [Ochrobactrum phage POA1180]AOT25346.1 hypothetical protein POA1180_38 [Ochrobactrum phage POA1180]KAB2691979.1 hypothetical protein F9K82_08705 [Brucella pseudogrignonensis]
MFNPFSEEERLQTMLACCYAGAQLGFRHIALRNIIDPPSEWFDAILARQVAVHILASQFGVPRRRIVIMQARRRSAVATAIRTIDARLECPVFHRAYLRMANRAADLFNQELEKAAA